MADNRLANPCIILHTLCLVSYKLAGEYFGNLSSFAKIFSHQNFVLYSIIPGPHKCCKTCKNCFENYL